MNKELVIAGAVGAAGIILAAFGAHALAPETPARLLRAYYTGADLHLAHAPVLLALALADGNARLSAAFWLILAGVVLFSGSLYALALLAWRPLGAVTPLGGVILIAGWATTAYAGLKSPARGLSN
ncbi:MAG: DUF423 domain-containing protein [Parvularculaceae bacterium]